MRLYFFDDSGIRTADTDRPHFILAGFGIDADEYGSLQREVSRTARAFGVNLSYPTELKANHGGRVGKYPEKNHLYRAGLTRLHERKALLLSVLNLLRSFESVKAIAVVSNNAGYLPKKQRVVENESDVMTDSMKLVMERVEMDLQDHKTQGIVFLDEERGSEPRLRDVFRTGTDFVKRKRVFETVASLPSEESIGIQMADLIAGGIGGWANSADPAYARYIWPIFRQYKGNIHGAGLKTSGRGRLEEPGPCNWSDYDKDILNERAAGGLAPLEWQENNIPINPVTGEKYLFP